MTKKENILSGGNMNQVLRIGDTVHRNVKGHPMLPLYLMYLEEAGMPSVPRYLGLDADGREILTYLPGKTMGPDYPVFHPCLTSDQTIKNMARFMRKLHDVSVGFLRPAFEGGWNHPDFSPGQIETICHNDAAIWNFVFVDDQLSGLFDFDTACPGPRIWDLALSLFSVIPLSGHVPNPEMKTCEAYDPSRHATERKRRIRLFFDAYGMECPPDMMDWVVHKIQKDFCDSLSNGAAAGDMNCIRMIKEGHLTHYQNVVSFIHLHGCEWM